MSLKIVRNAKKFMHKGLSGDGNGALKANTINLYTLLYDSVTQKNSQNYRLNELVDWLFSACGTIIQRSIN